MPDLKVRPPKINKEDVVRIALTFGLALLASIASSSAQTRPSLEARFIGNMAYAISDGATTLFTDFPYESGYSGYMKYDAREIRSRTARSVALITHRHSDHCAGMFGYLLSSKAGRDTKAESII